MSAPPCAWHEVCGNASVTKILHPLEGPQNVCVPCGRKILDLCAAAQYDPPVQFGSRHLVRLT